MCRRYGELFYRSGRNPPIWPTAASWARIRASRVPCDPEEPVLPEFVFGGETFSFFSAVTGGGVCGVATVFVKLFWGGAMLGAIGGTNLACTLKSHNSWRVIGGETDESSMVKMTCLIPVSPGFPVQLNAWVSGS